MKLAVIGTGNFGSALARTLKAGGFDVVLGSRKNSESNQRDGIQILTHAQAVSVADIIFLAIPNSANSDTISNLAPLGNRILVDCTNPVSFTNAGVQLIRENGLSVGETMREHHPQAIYVKSFNQIGAAPLEAAAASGVHPVMFVASNHQAAKQSVLSIAAQVGFDAHDCGPEDNVIILNAFAVLWMGLAFHADHGSNFAFVTATILQAEQ